MWGKTWFARYYKCLHTLSWPCPAKCSSYTKDLTDTYIQDSLAIRKLYFDKLMWDNLVWEMNKISTLFVESLVDWTCLFFNDVRMHSVYDINAFFTLEQINDISRLMNYLIKTSNASVIPVTRTNETTGRTLALNVKIGLTLYQIINVVRYEIKDSS